VLAWCKTRAHNITKKENPGKTRETDIKKEGNVNEPYEVPKKEKEEK